MRKFTDGALELIAERFQALSEPTRLKILNLLWRDGELTVTDLVERIETGQANVSKHLGVLHRHGMVERRKEGLHAFYWIADPVIFELCELMCGSLEEQLAARGKALERSGR